mmetsp:Transcript_12935/g.27932  ORF Transcript_12935/g.27932 Transcript_12935/m.27932 type:complete len:270 (-) Transcript_12935:204-1013(-)
MGRRNRSRVHYDEDDDGLEREWIRKRQRLNANRGESSHDTGTCSNESNVKQSTSSFKKTKTDAVSVDKQSSLHAKEAKCSSKKEPIADGAKIERLRLKKQKQKERRNEKKAAAEARKRQDASREEQQRKQSEQAKLDKEEKRRKLRGKKGGGGGGGSGQYRTLRKGVQVSDIIAGKGPVVQDRKKCRVRYILRSRSHISGKIIDSSSNFGFRVGKGEVIQGWDIGMEGMRVGGTRRLIVPSRAGYGNRDVGAGRGSDLFFEIELLHVAN